MILFIKLVCIVSVLILLCVMKIQFTKVKDRTKKRLESYDEDLHVLQTSFGKMTYVERGRGISLLSCHGICGGYDQAADSVAGKEDEFHVIAPSRFGYTGSDMPEKPTIEKQADAFAELLDHMKIDKTFVLSTSAGSASAIKFALKYPERTLGLILYCSGYPAMEAPKKSIKYAGPPIFLCNDLMMWILKPLFQPLMGMDSNAVLSIFPLHRKKKGIIFDAKVSNTDMTNHFEEYNLSTLSVPVLMIHAKDDKLADYKIVKRWSEVIPNCTLISLEDGGHLLKGHSDEINAALSQFSAFFSL